MNERKGMMKTPKEESSDDVPEAPQPNEEPIKEDEDDFPAEEFND